MNSKQIAIEYLAPKIEDPKEIFLNEEVFELILFFARDSLREYYSTQKSKMFLVHYVDDVGLIVDQYLINRMSKMYNDALKKKNKLFYNLCSSEKTVAWIIDRWFNVFLNLVSNPAFIEYIDIKKIKINIEENEISYESNIDDDIEFEKLQKLPKKQIVRALKSISKDTFSNNSIDRTDIEYLCKRFNINVLSILGKESNLEKLNIGLEPAGSRHNKQLFLLF